MNIHAKERAQVLHSAGFHAAEVVRRERRYGLQAPSDKDQKWRSEDENH